MWPKLNTPRDSDKHNEDKLFARSKYDLETTLSNSSVPELKWNIKFSLIPAAKTPENMYRNKQILNLNSASIKDIIFVTKAEIILKK